MLLVDFINVGYGDAILLRETETPFAMLVDCGDARIGRSRPDGRRITAADYLRREGIRELDLLVLTHLHLDHAGGLTHLLPGVRVREFWTNYLPPEEMWGHTLPAVPGAPAGARCLMTSMGIYVKALAHLRSQKTEIRLIRTPCDCRRLTETLSAGVFLEDEELRLRQASIWDAVLSGAGSSGDLEALDGFINNTSIRLRLICKETAVELPGDMYADCWEKHEIPPCTLVKLPHHGHRDSITPHLLDMLAPKTVVISVSNTRTDDCPAASVLQMVREKGCALYVTDAIPDSNGHVSNHPAIHFDI